MLRALPKLATKASSPILQRALEAHVEETRGHIERHQQIGERLKVKFLGTACEAMSGLIEEAKEVLEVDGKGPVIDAALVVAAQRVEHYETSAYRSARAIAEQLGESQVAKLLQKTLEEESANDEKLSKISERELLPAAGAGNGRGADDDADE